MAALLLLMGCDSGPESADAGFDASVLRDAGSIRRDAGARDAGADGGMDAGQFADAGSMLDGGADASPPDAGEADAASDASLGDASTSVAFVCAAPVLPNDSSSGMVLSASFWPGFRFEVPAGAGVTATSIGLTIDSSGGSIFAAIVKLTGPTDAPDAADLSGSDVVVTTPITLPSGNTSVAAPIDTVLGPGWYAAVYGTGAFDATIASATIHSNSGAGGCGSGFGFPFTLRQTDGSLILQAATPHMAVEATLL